VEVNVLLHTIRSALIISLNTSTPNDAYAASHVAGLDSRTTLYMCRPVTKPALSFSYAFVLCVCVREREKERERKRERERVKN
jgi:hypothetical protein